jgi:arylamine N-acetyltransferase
LLGVQWGKADLGTLEEIVGSQLTRVPFENISKLYHKRRTGLHGLIGFEEHLDGIQHHNFGGTCYANNYYLYRLLVNLGYDARLCGADMSNPDVHIVTMVRIDEREFLVDAGYGAPFLRPLPRDAADDVVISLGNERYVLKPREPDGCSRLQMFRDGVLKHGYRAKPAPRQIAGFDSVIKQSFDPTATFMNAVVLIRFEPGRSYVIRNLTFTESHNTYTYTQNLANREELTTCIGDVFGISRSVVYEALAQVPCFNDVWD